MYLNQNVFMVEWIKRLWDYKSRVKEQEKKGRKSCFDMLRA